MLGESAGAGVVPRGADKKMDAALDALYGEKAGRRRGGLQESAPQVARWLGDIREYFPGPVVRVLQQDAIERLDLGRLLLEPEMLEAVEPDVHLVGVLLSLNSVLPERARETAREVVRRVVREVEERLEQRLRSAVRGALERSARVRRPRRQADVDWRRTVHANLRNYLPERRTVVPERLVGFGRGTQGVRRDVILCVDQSGSMAPSVVYAGIFGAALASVPALRTSLVAFDTAVADLTDRLHDPVEVLFGTQLGGGTDVHRALAYCQGLVSRPSETVVVLVSDLYEGGPREEMLRRAAALVRSGVRLITLLALSDDGAPAYDHENAAALTALGVPVFACTPDRFPDLIAAALEHRDLTPFTS
ncbi:VWA domain-containing protein [Actinocorallia populi]|uniref:VWA domain-containing protein n=1 Tax=Actinocorallia populi TaxID=2079200 RepID=UPI001E629EE9|nr:VWA domain-containing protein [Actinocorallia populi]